MSEEKEGKYCSICGGIPPDAIKIRRILVEGTETGITDLDAILQEVAALGLSDDARIREELLKRAKAFNYIPTKKSAAYGEALMNAYREHTRQQTA